MLINNAGGALGLDTVAEGKDDDWEAMLQSNVLGVLRMTRAALPLMLDNPGSSLINIGSLAGRVAYEGGAAYCAAKAGELQITRALRLELSGTGIRVSTVDPGLAETEFSLVRFKGDRRPGQEDLRRHPPPCRRRHCRHPGLGRQPARARQHRRAAGQARGPGRHP